MHVMSQTKQLFQNMMSLNSGTSMSVLLVVVRYLTPWNRVVVTEYSLDVGGRLRWGKCHGVEAHGPCRWSQQHTHVHAASGQQTWPCPQEEGKIQGSNHRIYHCFNHKQEMSAPLPNTARTNHCPCESKSVVWIVGHPQPLPDEEQHPQLVLHLHLWDEPTPYTSCSGSQWLWYSDFKIWDSATCSIYCLTQLEEYQ